MVVDHLQTIFVCETVAVTYIYCHYKEHTKQTISELVASLLKQLVQNRSVTSDQVKEFYQDYRVNRKIRPGLRDLMKMLQSEIGTYSQTYIVVDALDECLERDRGDLITTLRLLSGNVSLMVTSRPLPSIELQFRGVKRLDILANDDDVRKYIEDRIPGENRLVRHVKRDPSFQEIIVNKIVVNAGGMSVFLMSMSLVCCSSL